MWIPGDENEVPDCVATIGGTFDTLHLGHKQYIRLAFKYAHRLLIYVTTDDYVNGKKRYFANSYEQRVAKLTEFLQQTGHESQYQIKALHHLDELKRDYLESALKEKIFMAVVTPEYYEFFLALNHAREALGMQSFLILVKQRTRDFQYQDISSTRVREKLPCPENSSYYIQPALENVAAEISELPA